MKIYILLGLKSIDLNQSIPLKDSYVSIMRLSESKILASSVVTNLDDTDDSLMNNSINSVNSLEFKRNKHHSTPLNRSKKSFNSVDGNSDGAYCIIF